MSFSQREVEQMLKAKENELMYEKEKQQLTLIENKIADMNRKSFLNAAETEVLNELYATADKLRGELPNEPVTIQNNARSFNGGGFKSFGELLQAAAKAAAPGGQADQRLYNAAASGLNEQVPSEGGFLVQQDFQRELINSVYETGKLAKLCKRIPISSNANGIKINCIDETSRATGSRFGAVQGYWLQEAGEKLGSKPKFRQINLELKKLIGLCYSSDELLQDAAALAVVIRDAFVSEIGFKIDDAILNGSGAGQPLGILNAGCLVSVPKESGQKAATIVAENVIKMYSRLLPGSESSAVWLINKNVLPQLYTMSLAVGTGGVPLYMPANSMAGQPYNTLFGRPVITVEQCATLGTVGDIVLADLAGGYILADKGGIQADMSIHVQFIYDQSTFRFVYRVDGQPILSSPITPYAGGSSATQSTFIALATRA